MFEITADLFYYDCSERFPLARGAAIGKILASDATSDI